MKSLSALLFALLGATCLLKAADAFAPPTTHATTRSSTSLQATTDSPELFKAGLLANCEEEAADLASKRVRSVKDLGFKNGRPASIRPRYWAWGGADEVPIQDKANYDTSIEPWLTLEEFYSIVKDDTAVADTVFVALAGGRAFVERDVAEQVIAEWYNNKKFDRSSFFKTVKKGQQDFLVGWGTFLGITGFSVIGIVFPTNPLQMALVNGLEVLTGNLR